MCNEAYNTQHWTSLQFVVIFSTAVSQGRLFCVHTVNNYFLICISELTYWLQKAYLLLSSEVVACTEVVNLGTAWAWLDLYKEPNLVFHGFDL